MKSGVTVRLRDWGDGTAELYVLAVRDKFGGEGSAHFNLAALKDLAKQLTKYPLSNGETVSLRGGYWSRTNPGEIAEEHVYIGVTQASATGRVVMEVRLAKPSEENTPHKGRFCSVSLVLPLEYQQLQTFANELADLVIGHRDEVVIEAHGDWA